MDQKNRFAHLSYGFETRAIHAGYNPADCEGALCPPLHMSSTFVFDTAQDGGARFSGEAGGYVYSRIGNPTQALLEERLAQLEGGEAALATASGMGAITATVWSLVEPGDEVIVDRTLYGCTFAFFRHGVAKFGVKVRHVDLTDPANLDREIGPRTKLVYFETPANPNMRLIDIARVSEIAHAAGAKVVVDNTYATPFIQRPIEHGADLVVHSMTKYMGGHGDLLAGAVIGDAETLEHIRLYGLKDMTGAVIAPMSAFLVLRGLKTLAVRMRAHVENARKLADVLAASPKVARVDYPGLDGFAQKDLAERQMDLPGGMIAFEMKGGREAGLALMNNLGLVARAVSLGDAESLIQHPASMTHSTYSEEERAEFGITEGLLRLSAGLETADDLVADLQRALDCA